MNLSINLNKIALLRNARGEDSPSLLYFANQALKHDIAGLTLHPRPDLRHIKPHDVYLLKKIVEDEGKLLNIEGNPLEAKRDKFPGYCEIIEEAKPYQATLVPDDSSQITSDHGWQSSQIEVLTSCAARIKPNVAVLSIFVDSDTENLAELISSDINAIEIFTGPYAKAFATGNQNLIDDELRKVEKISLQAKDLGLQVNAGHDLDYNNLKPLVKLKLIDEVSIGHAIIGDSLINGFNTTINNYLEIING
jgi:pyridoxine 5-phosphate synthase